MVAGYNNAAGQTTLDPNPHYYVLPPGQSLIITGNAKGNGTEFYVNMAWWEV